MHRHRRRGHAFSADGEWLNRVCRSPCHEMAMHVLAYNLTRVMNIMGIQPLMEAMKA